MNKNNRINIILIIIISIFAFLYFTKNDYKQELDDIKLKYDLKYDSLHNDIESYKLTISKLDSINNNYNDDIDSIKNKQINNEIHNYTPFSSLPSDTIASIFSEYDVSKKFN